MHRKVISMTGVAALLTGAALLQSAGLDPLTIGTLCLAVGASNTIFRRDGKVSIGVTYMTGTLVKLGHKLADAALGGARTVWLPYLMFWSSRRWVDQLCLLTSRWTACWGDQRMLRRS